MNFRPYQPADKAACLAIFDGNTPDFFAPHERTDFDEFLREPGGLYFVVENESDTIVACGGVWHYSDEQIALTWGMVSRTHHRHGIGRWLLLKRLQYICTLSGTLTVVIDTSQFSAPFFEKFDFHTTQITRDGFAPGLDKIAMQLPLTSAQCQRISAQLARLEQPET
jgi:GNAT superfamily N-acetyltransferase